MRMLITFVLHKKRGKNIGRGKENPPSSSACREGGGLDCETKVEGNMECRTNLVLSALPFLPSVERYALLV